jgi:hypothetical protein
MSEIEFDVAASSFGLSFTTPVASVVHIGNPNAFVSQSSSLGTWILDSGASDHMSGNKLLFSHLTFMDSLPNVTLANGSQTKCEGIGQVNPLPTLTLDSVLYVPGCPFNLISISKLTHTLPYSVTFVKNSVLVQDQNIGNTIGVGYESCGLYYLSAPTLPIACSAVESPLVVHQRLGHPSLQKLHLMVPNLSKVSTLECESCQFGKHTRSSFPDRVNKRAASPFALVHSDIWGPSRVVSSLGYQYFVTFIDDFSRNTWIFFMTNRSDVFPIFQTFLFRNQNTIWYPN